MNTNPKKFPKFSMILGILATVTALAGAITAVVTIPNIGCKVGWNSSKCLESTTESQKEVELYVLNETGDSLAGVEVKVIGHGAPEIQYTDRNGFTKVKIASTGDVQIVFKAKGYPVQDIFINLENSPTITRQIRLAQTGQPIISIPTPTPTVLVTTTPSTSPSPPSPSPSSTSSPDNPIVEVDSNVTWQLESCIREQKNISCIFTISTSADQSYGIALGQTKIVDNEGNEYFSSKIQIGKRNASSGNNLSLDLIKDAHYKTTIDFTEVPTSTSQVALLQIGTIYGHLIKYRQVPIRN